MSDYFTQGFAVREPSWHRKEVLLPEYITDIDEMKRLAGHDWSVIEAPVAEVDDDLEHPEVVRVLPDWKVLKRSDDGTVLHVARDSYQVIQNEVPWEVIQALNTQPNIQIDTAGTLHDGRVCWVSMLDPRPSEVPGDPSPYYSYVSANWSHDGSGAFSVRNVNVRQVCANTVKAAELESTRSGREYTFRHTVNVMDRIADAKKALDGIRSDHERFIEFASELIGVRVDAAQREQFVTRFIPAPPDTLISDRVAANIEQARRAVRGILESDTTKEIADTAWGLVQAGVEYLDHLRRYRDNATYVKRTLLRPEPAKNKLIRLVHDVVGA